LFILFHFSHDGPRVKSSTAEPPLISTGCYDVIDPDEDPERPLWTASWTDE
jgi:hypothetical protein